MESSKMIQNITELNQEIETVKKMNGQLEKERNEKEIEMCELTTEMKDVKYKMKEMAREIEKQGAKIRSIPDQAVLEQVGQIIIEGREKFEEKLAQANEKVNEKLAQTNELVEKFKASYAKNSQTRGSNKERQATLALREM